MKKWGRWRLPADFPKLEGVGAIKGILKSAIHYLGYEIQARPRPSRYALFEEPDDRDYEQLRSFAARAARFSASAQQANAIRSLYRTGLLTDQPQTSYSRFDIGDENTLSLGVWRREGPGMQMPFIRDPRKDDEWFYWAKQERIEPKRTRWRVVLLGESVARGYFYDPHFNPAGVLQTILESELGPGKIDVVDLARSNLRIPELRACIGQSLALSPDILVIFAGNNWHPHLSESDIPYVESLLRQQGVPGMKAYLDEKREQTARNLITQANGLLTPRNVKIVWVIPEFNLRDWLDPPSAAPLLPGDGNKHWRELDVRMRQAVRDADWARAQKSAEQMTRLDGGTSSVPLRVLASCCHAQKDTAAERGYLELCREAEGWDPSFSFCPRVFLSTQKALREASAFPGNAVVDLPEILGRHLDGGLPGRQLFLDYCHMSAEGINVASAEIAARILSLVAGVRGSARSLLDKAHAPPAEIEGRACFLAAAHNAAFYQGNEVVNYWCSRALRFWPECAQLMARFAEYVTSRDLPMMLCKPMLEFDALDRLDTRDYLGHGRMRRLDITFGDAALAALADIGIEIEPEIADLRISEHSPRSGPKELTDFFYSAAIPAVSDRGWTSRSFPTNRGSHSIYASAFWETSVFVFFAEKGQDIGITFTYRVRLSPLPHGTVTVDVNGGRLAELPAEPNWCTRRIFVPNEYIVDGLNKISIAWPTDEPTTDVLLSEAADSLLAMRLPYFSRVFGEIHTLSVGYDSKTVIRPEMGH
jgi:hypothetical protein